jgi:hypothetical protein
MVLNLTRYGQARYARDHLEECLRIAKDLPKPEDRARLFDSLAWILATSKTVECRDGRRAVELSTESCALTNYERAPFVGTLAAAYAETGHFDAAIKWGEKALQMSGRMFFRDEYGKRLDGYRAEKPWRDESL